MLLFHLFSLIFVVYSIDNYSILTSELPLCIDVRSTQKECTLPKYDPKTSSHPNCHKNKTIDVNCTIKDMVDCTGPRHFTKTQSCIYTNGISYEKALTLSVLLGYFGIDRFYLGYYATGILKLVSGGFFIIGSWIDAFLILTQQLGPADGSFYEINSYKVPRFDSISSTDFTQTVTVND